MDVNWGRVVQIAFQPMQYLIYRAGIYGVVGAGVIAYLMILGFVGLAFGFGASLLLFILSAVLSALPLAARYAGFDPFASIKLGYLALITEILNEGQLPWGVSEPNWARSRVSDRFRSATGAGQLCGLVLRALRDTHRSVLSLESLVPIARLAGSPKLAKLAANGALIYLPYVILAKVFRTESREVFTTVKDSVVKYAHSGSDSLRLAALFCAVGYALLVPLTVLFLVPLGSIAMFLPASTGWSTMRLVFFLTAVVLSFMVKWIVFDPIALTAVAINQLDAAEDQGADPAAESRLEEVSPAFREINRLSKEERQ
ncbi:MAG: hypothetical protein HY706_16280 [Candidatus Hydrogenedentes bacterium]|nr:hypothetical protein [Candidatus Hydrogenedentota bacterium]